MRTFVATSSQDKLRELRELFAGSMLTLGTVEGYTAPVEDGETYMDNALIKARALRTALLRAGVQAAVLADDSGIEIQALDGRPGVHSARYAGEDATWETRLQTLLDEMDGVEDRACRYVCFFAFIDTDGHELVVMGDVRGTLTRSISEGTGGFGYDPLFFYDPAGKTFAEVSDAYKNTVSHRAIAAQNLLSILKVHADSRASN